MDTDVVDTWYLATRIQTIPIEIRPIVLGCRFSTWHVCSKYGAHEPSDGFRFSLVLGSGLSVHRSSCMDDDIFRTG